MEDYKEKYEQALERARVWKEKSGMPVDKQGILDDIFPELKKSDDEEIRKTLKSFFDSEISDYGNVEWRNGIRYGEIVSWLEKQGKQKPIIEGTFVDVDEVRENFMQEVYRVLDADSTNDRANQIIDAFDHLPTITIQKPTDKVEPKFKIGDWIVSNRTNKTYKIDSIDTKDANYIIYSCVPSVYTNEDSPCFSESMIHLWTIQDAKDGDVLACPSGWTCIFKSLYGDTFSSYCFIDKTGWFCEKGSECHTLNKEFTKAYNGEIKPATKEQRNLLFQKMHEAGYVWDSENIVMATMDKQKPAWSEEDENLYTRCMSAIQTRFNDGLFTTNEYRQTSLWLKSLKERIQSQSN